MRVYSQAFRLAIFCTADSNPVLARENIWKFFLKKIFFFCWKICIIIYIVNNHYLTSLLVISLVTIIILWDCLLDWQKSFWAGPWQTDSCIDRQMVRQTDRMTVTKTDSYKDRQLQRQIVTKTDSYKDRQKHRGQKYRQTYMYIQIDKDKDKQTER